MKDGSDDASSAAALVGMDGFARGQPRQPPPTRAGTDRLPHPDEMHSSMPATSTCLARHRTPALGTARRRIETQALLTLCRRCPKPLHMRGEYGAEASDDFLLASVTGRSGVQPSGRRLVSLASRPNARDGRAPDSLSEHRTSRSQASEKCQPVIALDRVRDRRAEADRSGRFGSSRPMDGGATDRVRPGAGQRDRSPTSRALQQPSKASSVDR